jgi:hypothetical protein
MESKLEHIVSEMVARIVVAIKGCDPSAGAPYEETARAVIAAMREPTTAMVDAKQAVDMLAHGDPDDIGEWYAMIDAALNTK